MRLEAFLSKSIERLRSAGVDNPSLDARLLAGHALGMDRAAFLSQSSRLLTSDEMASIEPLLNRRMAREPVARILGKREFWGLDFKLNEATLEPRPDSETLVETVLEFCEKAKTYKIFDLGTGTGCLLLSLLHELPLATGIGVDLCPRAVEQAKENAVALGLDARSSFIAGNWLDDIAEKADVIISNPPYIPSADIPGLMPEVRNHDPRLALDGGDEGLAPYRLLIPMLGRRLSATGLVVFEVGQGQASAVTALFRQNDFDAIEIRKDLGGVERCVVAKKRL